MACVLLVNCRWTGVELHRLTGSLVKHMSGLLADGVGTGRLHHRHGHCWRGALNVDFFFFFEFLITTQNLSLLSPFYRSVDGRRATGTGPDWARDTTPWPTVVSRSQRGSAPSRAATPPQDSRSNTSWRARRGRSGTCSTRTGRITVAQTISKAFSVSSYSLDLYSWRDVHSKVLSAPPRLSSVENDFDVVFQPTWRRSSLWGDTQTASVTQRTPTCLCWSTAALAWAAPGWSSWPRSWSPAWSTTRWVPHRTKSW